jgi:hypothetical protein
MVSSFNPVAPASEIVSGTITALNGTVGGNIDALPYQSISAQVSGTFTATLTFQVSNDGVTWVSKAIISSTASSAASTTTSAGVWSGDLGARYFRVIATAFTSGTANVTIQFSAASQFNAVATQPVSGSLTSAGTTTATPATGSSYNVVTAATTNGANIKTTAANLYEVTISNVTATAAFVKFYNKASAPTVGTDVPVLTISAPANTTVAVPLGTLGKRFVTGLGIAVTANAVATDSTATVVGIQINATYI